MNVRVSSVVDEHMRQYLCIRCRGVVKRSLYVARVKSRVRVSACERLRSFHSSVAGASSCSLYLGGEALLSS